jgi:hypothetical protein
MPQTPAEWDAYRALPEWEVTAVMRRTARFRVHAAGSGGGAAMLHEGANGIRALDDLYDGSLDVDHIISVVAVAEPPAEGSRG